MPLCLWNMKWVGFAGFSELHVRPCDVGVCLHCGKCCVLVGAKILQVLLGSENRAFYEISLEPDWTGGISGPSAESGEGGFGTPGPQ